MNILIAADLVVRSGVGGCIQMLSRQMAGMGHRVVVASPQIELDLSSFNDTGQVIIEAMEPRALSWKHLPSTLRFLHRLIQTYDIECVHCHHRKMAFVLGCYNKLYPKIPVVWTAHTVPYPSDFFRSHLAYYGHACIAISCEARKFMEQTLHIAPERIVTVLNGVDVSALRSLSQKEKEVLSQKWNLQNRRVIALHGRLDPVKGLDLAVEAAALLEGPLKETLVFLCSGETHNNPYYESLKAIIEENHLEEHFVFTGWASTRQVLGMADVLLMPSRREGFPLSALEAFVMKVPVIRTPAGGYEDTREFCRRIEMESPSDIVTALQDFAEHPDVYRKKAQKAWDFAMAHCTAMAMAQKTLDVYKKAIAACKEERV